MIDTVWELRCKAEGLISLLKDCKSPALIEAIEDMISDRDEDFFNELPDSIDDLSIDDSSLDEKFRRWMKGEEV